MKSGFRTTGIVPVDRSKYPCDMFDSRLLKRYNMLVELGKPEEMVADIIGCTETPSKLKPASDSQNDFEDVCTSTPSNTADAPLSESPSLSVSDNCRECESMGPKPPPIKGKVWVRGWTLIDAPKQQEVRERSFEDRVLDRMKGPQVKKAPQPRKKINKKTKVLTDQAYLGELKRIEDEAKQKQEALELRREKRSKPQAKANSANVPKKKLKLDDSSSDDESENETSGDDDDDESDEDEGESDDGGKDVVESEEESGRIERKNSDSDKNTDEDMLLDLWKSLSPPTEEHDVTQKWFGVIYESNRTEVPA